MKGDQLGLRSREMRCEGVQNEERTFVVDDLSGLKPTRRGEDRDRLSVLDTLGEFLGRESTKHGRVNRTNSSAGSVATAKRQR